MTKRISIPYGFNRMVIGDMHLFTIKLRFSQLNADSDMEVFFYKHGFTSYEGKPVDFKTPARVFVFQTTNVLDFEDTCSKVQEYLITRKISKLQKKLVEVTGGSSSRYTASQSFEALL